MSKLKRISISVYDDEYESINKVKDQLGTSFTELTKEAYFHFFTHHKDEISSRMQQKVLDGITKREQKNLHFVHNWYRRLTLHLYPDYRLFGTVNHEKVKSIIKNAEEYFDTLPQHIQVLLQKEFEHFKELKNEIAFNNWIANKLGEEVKIIKKIR